VAEVIEANGPATVEKLRRASPHCMHHTHATAGAPNGRCVRRPAILTLDWFAPVREVANIALQ